ncbi:MAG: phage major tail tube protein [Oscillospiraceae bacterium]|nr:phage major tail tube protein [Oscillospiraceae bacterium]
MRVNESIINFAVYSDKINFLGMADVELPELSNMTAQISGAGIGGEYESVIMGHLQAMTLKLNFRTLTKEAVVLYEQRNHQIDLRVAQQDKDTVAGQPQVTGVKHIMVVQPKKLHPGKVNPASSADASGEYAVTYWATFIDGKKVLEIDILNFIFFINDTDYLRDVRRVLGKDS